MCEIMSIPGDSSTSAAIKASSKMFASNNDGLGIVAVYRRGDKFGYRFHKREDPDWQDVRGFFDENEPWRFVIHARLATAGGTGVAETHPIRIVDDDVDVDFVIHNGHVHDFNLRRELLRDGHEFNTQVDSEVIGHAHGRVPDNLDDDFDQPNLSGTLNYLLFADNGILVRNTGKYHLKDSLLMTCRGDYVDGDHQTQGYTLFHPDGRVETADVEHSPLGATSTTGGWGTRKGVYKPSGAGGGYSSEQGTGTDLSKYTSTSDSDSGNGSTGSNRQSQSDVTANSGRLDDVGDNASRETYQWLMDHQPSYWRDMNKRKFCSMHRRTFQDVCPSCADNMEPDEMKTTHYDQGYKTSRHSRY